MKLTFSEAVEPRFAIVSVTDADAEAARRPRAGAGRPTTPTRWSCRSSSVREGWYLVYWRVISVDGHPVRGAFTFQVGPNPGPAPQFPMPSISETAATPRLVVARSARVPRRDERDRPVRAADRDRAAGRPPRVRARACAPLDDRVRRRRGRRRSSRSRTTCCSRPRTFALRSWTDVGALVPLMRASAFGRGFLDLEICFALFVLAAARRDLGRPARARAALDRGAARDGGALAAAVAVLLVPGAAGHAAQTAPRGALARARLDPPRGRLDLARRPRSACSCSGSRCRRRSAARGSSSRCRASRTSRSSSVCCCSARASGRRSSTCRRSARSGRRRTGRR